MRIAIVQFETRNDDNLEVLMNRNRKYAQKHGYDYIARRKPYEGLPPYWAKVRLIQEVFRSDYDVVFMLDSDACIHDQTMKIEDVLKMFPGKCFLYSPDCPLMQAIFNAGVVLVCRPHGPQIVDDWMSLYNPSRWSFDEERDSWKCEGDWAGPDYEQGSFEHNMIRKEEYPLREFIHKVPSVFFQGPFANDRYLGPQFSVHFAGTELKVLMKEYVKDSAFLDRYCECRSNGLIVMMFILVLTCVVLAVMNK